MWASNFSTIQTSSSLLSPVLPTAVYGEHIGYLPLGMFILRTVHQHHNFISVSHFISCIKLNTINRKRKIIALLPGFLSIVAFYLLLDSGKNRVKIFFQNFYGWCILTFHNNLFFVSVYEVISSPRYTDIWLFSRGILQKQLRISRFRFRYWRQGMLDHINELQLVLWIAFV